MSALTGNSDPNAMPYSTSDKVGSMLGSGLPGMVSAPFQIYGSQLEQAAMNQAIEEELARQRVFEQKGQGILAEHIKQSSVGETNKDLAEGSKKAYSAFQNAPSVAPSQQAALPTLGGSFMGARATGANNVSNANSAQAQGYTDWGVKQALQALKAKTALAQNSMFSQQSEGVLPSEIGAAQNSQSGMKAFGSLLGDAAGIAAMAAL